MISFVLYFFCMLTKPPNFHVLRQIRNAPPSHIGKTKSDKVGMLMVGAQIKAARRGRRAATISKDCAAPHGFVPTMSVRHDAAWRRTILWYRCRPPPPATTRHSLRTALFCASTIRVVCFCEICFIGFDRLLRHILIFMCYVTVDSRGFTADWSRNCGVSQ
jgi:hypothetical protein